MGSLTLGQLLYPQNRRVLVDFDPHSFNPKASVSGSPSTYNSKGWPLFLTAALLMGILLRLSFPLDMEYKGDEKFMFDATQQIGVTQPWPLLGMTSGAGMKNPGLSIWIFEALKKISRAQTPPELVRAVELLNILGLFLLALFSFRILPEPERTPWLWATAFAAVNPFAVIFSRKIWAQDTLFLFCVLFWIAWHYRKNRAGAFFWGLVGICIGQIHMSGFFLAAGVFLWTYLKDRQARWGYWTLGSALGAVPLIPWIQYMASRGGGGFNWANLLWILYPKYWFYWLTNALGLGLNYSLKTHQYLQFMRYPLLGGQGTYLVAVMHAVIIVSAALILLGIKRSGGFSKGIAHFPQSSLAVHSTLIASGLLMTFCAIKICRHYLIMTFPLEWVWLSKMGLQDARWGARYLAALWIAQLFISAAFLVFIHINHGDPLGDYGVAYQYQPGN